MALSSSGLLKGMPVLWMLWDAEPTLSFPSNSSRVPLVLVLSPSGAIAANRGDEPVGGVCLDL